MTVRPDEATLYAWGRRWRAIQKAAYRDLVASYTPEQREMVRRMNHANHQRKLCWSAAVTVAGGSGKRAETVAWPEEPAPE